MGRDVPAALSHPPHPKSAHTSTQAHVGRADVLTARPGPSTRLDPPCTPTPRSGIVAVVCNGMVMAMYVKPNLSKAAAYKIEVGCGHVWMVGGGAGGGGAGNGVCLCVLLLQRSSRVCLCVLVMWWLRWLWRAGLICRPAPALVCCICPAPPTPAPLPDLLDGERWMGTSPRLHRAAAWMIVLAGLLV